MHPSKDIIGSKSNKLGGKTICLCVTGSVAASTSSALCRELMRHGAEIITVMTEAATRIIHPDLLHWATGNKVVLELTGAIEHIEIAGERPKELGKADLILIAPATANTISKIACGIDDTPVTTVATTAFGSKTPIIIVPAMHESMYNHPIVQENMKKLQSLGVDLVLPRVKESKAKIAETEEIVDLIINKLMPNQSLKNLNFIVTAGPSREMIDRVRFISNPSTGKMGIAFAEEIIKMGGDVTLILGKTSIKPPNNVKTINVISANDFLNALNSELANQKYNVLISAAALADFMPITKEESKISSDNENLTIQLKSTPKLINKAREKDPNLYIVAFKAETNFEKETLVEKAYKRLQSAKTDMIIANNVNMDDKERGFESDTNEVYVIDKNKNVEHIELSSKNQVASRILEIIQSSL